MRESIPSSENGSMGPAVGHPPVVFQQLPGSQRDRGEGVRWEGVKLTAEG